jgi:hypothetical protein
MNDDQVKYIKRLILSAKGGDREAGIEIIEQYVSGVFAGKIPHKYILDYVAYGLNHILDGKDPKEALHIKRPNKKPKKDEDELEEIAVLIEFEVRCNKENKVKRPVQDESPLIC